MKIRLIENFLAIADDQDLDLGLTKGRVFEDVEVLGKDENGETHVMVKANTGHMIHIRPWMYEAVDDEN